MASLVFKDVIAYLGGYNYSTDFNSVTLSSSAELLDATTFSVGNVTRVRAKGLEAVTLSYDGFYDGASDAGLFPKIGLESQEVYTVIPDPSTPSANGDLAYFFQALAGSYNPGGSVGELMAFTISAESAGGPLVRGYVETDGEENFTSAGASFPTAGQQLGASTGLTIYAVLHVLGTGISGGTSLDCDVQSDDNSDFTSALTRASFTQVVGTDPVGSQYVTATGVSDDWYRFDFAIAGGTPNFTVMGLIGIK